MTIVVALKDEMNKRIIVGADNQGTSGQISLKYGSKIFDLNIPIVDGYGEILKFEKLYVAVSGNYWIINYLKYGFDIPPMDKEEDFLYYLYNQFFLSLGDCLTESRLVHFNSGVLDSGVGMLFVFRDNIYHVYDDFSIMECVECFDVDGSGYEVALGSLYTNLNFHKGMDYVKIVKQAVLSCAGLSIYCDDEVDVKIINYI